MTIQGRARPYRLRYSTRARHAALHIHPRRGLEVVLPQGAPSAAAERLLREKARWLERHAVEIDRAQRATTPLRTGVTRPLRGVWLTLALQRGERDRVVRQGGTLRLVSSDPDDEDALRALLVRWYRAEAKRWIPERVRALHGADDGPVRRIVVRDQDTLWGSCSGRGTLSFSWRLVMTPPAVLDAVVVHELVHLGRPDHSAEFWRRLDARFPQHRACRRWLDANAYRLGL